MTFYEGYITEQQIAQQIERAGFTAEVLTQKNCTASLSITSSSKTALTRDEVNELKLFLESKCFISDFSVESSDSSSVVKFLYDGDKIGLRTLLESIEQEKGHSVTLAPPVTAHQVGEAVTWRRYLMICLVLCIPIVLIAFILPIFESAEEALDTSIINGLTAGTLTSCILAAPIQVSTHINSSSEFSGIVWSRTGSV